MKFRLPKISGKKEEGPQWHISTKIYSAPEEEFLKERKRKTPWHEYCLVALKWVKNYVRTVGWFFGAGMIIVLLFVIFATPFFSLHPDKIEIVLKPEPVFDRSAIESLVADFSGKNIFSISTKEAFDTLSGNIRHIASVEKTLLVPDGMRITITSFPAAYRAYIGEEIFLLTENGQLIPDIAEVEVPKISIFHLVQDTNIAKKTPILPEDMQAISTIIESWSMHMKKNIEKLSFYEQEKELHILSEGTSYITQLTNGAEQIKKTSLLITNNNTFRVTRQHYIDIRIPGRIYTCSTEDEACHFNMNFMYGK